MLITSMTDHGEKTLISPLSLPSIKPSDEFLFSLDHQRILQGLRLAITPSGYVAHQVACVSVQKCRKPNCQQCQLTFASADVSVWLCWGLAGCHWYQSHLRLFRMSMYDLHHEYHKRGVMGIKTVVETAISVELRRQEREIRLKNAEMRTRGVKPVL